MEKDEAKEHFREATEWFNAGDFERSLRELEILEDDFPDNHRVLNAKARTLFQLKRHGEALTLCDRLLNEINYQKVRPLQQQILDDLDALEEQEQKATRAFSTPAVFDTEGHEDDEAIRDSADGPENEQDDMDSVERSEGAYTRFRISPFWILVLIAICVALYLHYIPYWLGGGLIAAYFILRLAK